MFLHHLVILSFLDGASGVAAVANFSGFTTHMPFAFFDGFSETGGGAGVGDYTMIHHHYHAH